MEGQKSFIDDLKHQYHHGGASIRLLFINVGVFLLINLLLVFGRLANSPAMSAFLGEIFALETDIPSFITHPWGLFTSLFAHFSFFHLLFNMVFLYFVGRVFEQLFDQKRLYYTYFVGGIFGGLFEILAHLIFPILQESNTVIVGASGSIMAIFFAVAFHRPTMKVNLFGLLPIRIIFVAGAFLLLDFLNLGRDDGTAHFAHLGGAILGMLSLQNLHSSGNIITIIQMFGDRVQRIFSRSGNGKLNVKKGNNTRYQTDEEYNATKKQKQEEIDRILDKISKSGYDSLTKREKDFLFNQSKNG